MTKLHLQNLAWTLKACTQSLNKNYTLWPNSTFQICTKLLSARFSSSTWVTVTTSTSFELSSSHQSSLLNSSELVSDSVSDKHSQWSDSGPIKRKKLNSHQQDTYERKTKRWKLSGQQKERVWSGRAYWGRQRWWWIQKRQIQKSNIQNKKNK